MTLREAHIAAAHRLAADPDLAEHATLDAATLLLYAVNLNRAALHAHPERPLTEKEAGIFDALLTRRLQLEPIQYILGEQEFYGLSLRVSPAVLIPRPETELLVEAVLNRLARGRELSLIDVGTGSGAIAIALAEHLPQARIVAVDLSLEAIAVARENAQRHGVAARVAFQLSDLLAAVPSGARFDAIVSNPPYIPEADRATLHPQVREHEPSQALFAGHDGLTIYRSLIPEALDALRPGGLLALEFGYGQAEALTQMLSSWTDVEVLADLQGIPRIAMARGPL